MTPEALALARAGSWAPPSACLLSRKRCGLALVAHVAGSTPAQGGRRKRICRALGDQPAGRARRVEEGTGVPSAGFRGWVPLPTIEDAPADAVPNAGLVAASKVVLGGLGAAAVVAAGFEFSSHLVDSLEAFPPLANLELLVGGAVTARAVAGYFTNTAARTSLDQQLSKLLGAAWGALGGVFKAQGGAEGDKADLDSAPISEKSVHGAPLGAPMEEDGAAEDREPTMLEVELRSLVDASAAAASEWVEREQRPPASAVVVDRRVLVESMAQYVRSREHHFNEGHQRLQQDLEVSEAIRTSLVQLQKSKARRAAVQARLSSARALPKPATPSEERGAQDQLMLQAPQHPLAAQEPEGVHAGEVPASQALTAYHEQALAEQEQEPLAGLGAVGEAAEEAAAEAAEEASHSEHLLWASSSGQMDAEEEGGSHGEEQTGVYPSSSDAGLFSDAIAVEPHGPTREAVPCANGTRGFPGLQALASMSGGGALGFGFGLTGSSSGAPHGSSEASPGAEAEGQALAFLSEGGASECEGSSAGEFNALESFSGHSASHGDGDWDAVASTGEGEGEGGVFLHGDGNSGNDTSSAYVSSTDISTTDDSSADVSSLGSGLSALSLAPSASPEGSLEMTTPSAAEGRSEEDQEFDEDIAAAFERAREFRAKLQRLKTAREQRRKQDQGVVEALEQTPMVHLETAAEVVLPEAVANPME